MALNKIIDQIKKNQERISDFGKWDDKTQKKINYKLRLDWNYYSNSMEGGTLTKEETRSVMVGNIDVKGKPLKDVFEMTGHDKMVIEVLKMSSKESRISEKRIKEIHKAIMHEEDPEKVDFIGKWKTVPNEIINYKGEKILFSQPGDVSDEIHQLIDETNAELDRIENGRSKKHPIEMIAKFHVDYVSIHPFYDGNGRTARILTNILLLGCDLPVIIIKEDQNKRYKQLLADIQVYGGNIDFFTEFIGERVIDTQELILKALNGDEIEEPDDLDKKIAMLEMELSSIDENEEVKHHFSQKVFYDIYDRWLHDLIEKVIPKIQKMNSFFIESQHVISFPNAIQSVSYVNEDVYEIIDKVNQNMRDDLMNFRTQDAKVTIDALYGTFKKGGDKAFGCNYGIQIKFKPLTYTIIIDLFSEDEGELKKMVYTERLLHKPLSENEQDEIVKILMDNIFKHIDFHTKRIGLR